MIDAGTYEVRSPADLRWWPEHGKGDSSGAPHTKVFNCLRRIQGKQSYRSARDALHLQLYGDLRYVGYDANYASWNWYDLFDAQSTENVIRSVIQTHHAKIVKNKPRATCVTEGGNWEFRQRAANMDKFVAGQMYQLDGYTLTSDALMHALIVGTGAIKTFNDGEKVRAEVAPSWELWVDPSEARYGTPRTLYQVKAYDRLVLQELWKEFRALLEKSACLTGLGELTNWDATGDSDMVTVCEAWHLPSGPNATDGRRVICVDNATLVNAEWKRDKFPFAWMPWDKRPVGFWGCGVPETLMGQQMELARVTAARVEALRMLSAPFWLVEKGSKVIKSHLSNLIGRIVEYVGVPPQVHTPQAVNPELFLQSDRVKAGMFEASGTSQLSAQMQKPAGLNSGKALRTYADMESERNIAGAQAYENFVLEFDKLLLEEAKELGEQNKTYSVIYVGDQEIEKIAVTDIQLESYSLKILPTSSLSSTVAGRLEDIAEMDAMGMVPDPAQKWELLNIPYDKQRATDQALAPLRLLRKVIEIKIATRGEYVHPEPTWPLEEALQLATTALLDLQLNDGPERNQELLRQFLDEVQRMIAPPATAASPGAPPPPNGGLPAPAPGDPTAGALPPADPALALTDTQAAPIPPLTEAA